MLVISHRGLHHRCPENTLAAFEEAVAMGVDGIETDVRASADGLPVLFHDRSAPDGTEVAHATREELSRAAGFDVPTLDEALELWGGGLWNIEIKTPAALEAARDSLACFSGSREILVTSFWHDVVGRLDVPGVARGLLMAHRPAGEDDLRRTLDAVEEPRAVVWHYEVLDPDLIAIAKDRGVASFAYSTKTADEHWRCAELELDGVITDHPAYLIERGHAGH